MGYFDCLRAGVCGTKEQARMDLQGGSPGCENVYRDEGCHDNRLDQFVILIQINL